MVRILEFVFTSIKFHQEFIKSFFSITIFERPLSLKANKNNKYVSLKRYLLFTIVYG